MVKREGYPGNYEFTGERTPVLIDSYGQNIYGFIVGFEQMILEYHGYPVPPEGMKLVELLTGGIISIHDHFLQEIK